jgi:organic hydroperoxide reductase OsmC/OhrA
MAGKAHHYEITVEWTGNRGQGTSSYASYDRDHEVRALGKTPISGSADPAFRGDSHRWNPEDLLVASLSACHKLWYLHLCAAAGIVVIAYEDTAIGQMVEDPQKGGYFTEVTLRPKVTVTGSCDMDQARSLHHQAHEKCFISNSVTFPVLCYPEIVQV